MELLLVLGCVLLLVCSGFFSSSETALFSLDRLALHDFETRKDRGARRALRLLARPNRLLATILLGNTLVNVAFSSLGNHLFLRWAPQSDTWLLLLTITGLILIVGEIVPKCLALSFPRGIARGNSPILWAFEQAVGPVVALVGWFTDRLVPHPPVPEGGDESWPVTEIGPAEIGALVDTAAAEGHLTAEEHRLARRILDFAAVPVAAAMTPWFDVVRLAADAPRAEVDRVLRESRHSRIPVFRRGEEDIVGYLEAAGYLAHPAPRLDQHLRSVLLVPEQTPARDVLQRMHHRQQELVVVVNEHGRPVGIVTAEDLVEEVVGEIYDEYDPAEPPLVEALAGGRFRLSGRAPLETVEEALGVRLPAGEEEFATLSGYLCHLAGEIPESGREIAAGGMVFRVLEAEGNRILFCEARPLEPSS